MVSVVANCMTPWGSMPRINAGDTVLKPTCPLDIFTPSMPTRLLGATVIEYSEACSGVRPWAASGSRLIVVEVSPPAGFRIEVCNRGK